MIGRIAQRRAGETIGSKELEKTLRLSWYLGSHRSRAEEDSAAIGEEEEAIEEVEHLAVGLVDGDNDRHPLAAGETRDPVDDVIGGGAVKAASGLVEEEERRPGEELDADADAPPLMPLMCHPPILVSMAAANPISLIVASALARFAGVDMESGSWSCTE
ncbi:hypothetical protein ZIOFF_010342 [Zingiber officinale]|uniref:Uncharacterized protein n=1 Tax=Zingiber officinale TaxID=94328 RepID=A0A8J5HV91_ZINOF|nr:hypothetical protein ZIOFF_010342 [Zingiber officinale]